MSELVLVFAIDPDLIRGPVVRHDGITKSTALPRRSAMDTLFAILSVGILLAIFGVIAAIVGEDTRDGFGDDRAVFPRYR